MSGSSAWAVSSGALAGSTAADFKRSAKVNFTGNKSTRLRQRMKGLKPAKRLKETTFNWF
jgi:hypothetical protein